MRPGWRWLAALAGLLWALLLWAPASWLALALAGSTQQRVQLVQSAGSWRCGSARLLLGQGEPGAPPLLLDGRLRWRIDLLGLLHGSLPLRLDWDGAAAQALQLVLQARLHGWVLEQAGGWRLQLPAATLLALGTPWNTLAPQGRLQLRLQQLRLESNRGQLQLAGHAELELDQISSRLSPLPSLGSYQLQLDGAGSAVRFRLETLDGPLQLAGQGSWSASGLGFAGTARAAGADSAALDNLLGLIGQRQGDVTRLQF